MATLDLGKIKQVWKGTYNNGTAYVVDDLVAYTDSGILSTYICVANSTGNAPSSSGTAHASWNYVSKGVADPIPSQSGNSGKFLTSNGSAASWGTVTQAIKSVHTKVDGGRHSVSTQLQNNAYTSATSWSQMEITITPQSTSSKFHVTGTLNIHHASDYCGHIMISYQPSGGSETFMLSNSNGSIQRTFQGVHGNNSGGDIMSPMSLDLILEPNTTSATVFRIRLSTTSSGTPWYLNRTLNNTTDTSDGGDCLSSWTITELDGSLVTATRTTAQTYT